MWRRGRHRSRLETTPTLRWRLGERRIRVSGGSERGGVSLDACRGKSLCCGAFGSSAPRKSAWRCCRGREWSRGRLAARLGASPGGGRSGLIRIQALQGAGSIRVCTWDVAAALLVRVGLNQQAEKVEFPIVAMKSDTTSMEGATDARYRPVDGVIGALTTVSCAGMGRPRGAGRASDWSGRGMFPSSASKRRGRAQRRSSGTRRSIQDVCLGIPGYPRVEDCPTWRLDEVGDQALAG